MYGYVFENINGRSRMGKKGMLLRSQKTKAFLIGLCGWHQNGWKEAEFSPYGEEVNEERWYWGANIISWSRLLGIHSKTMRNKQRYCGQLQNHVWIANFRGESREITIHSKYSYFLHGLMTWLVMQRSVWNDIVSWQTRLHNNSTKVSTPCIDDHYFKEEDTKLVGELSNTCPEMLILGKNWDDLIFYGQWISSHDLSQNGPRPVTNAWIDWFHRFIILVNTNNSVIWEIPPNNAGWDCFKTPMLQEILRTLFQGLRTKRENHWTEKHAV